MGGLSRWSLSLSDTITVVTDSLLTSVTRFPARVVNSRVLPAESSGLCPRLLRWNLNLGGNVIPDRNVFIWGGLYEWGLPHLVSEGGLAKPERPTM